MNDEWIMRHTAPARFLPIKELVRCMDCKNKFEDEGTLWCNGWGWPARVVPKDGYCNKGDKETE